MAADDPSPDNDTMETLIETNEQLSKAMNQHQRAALAARKALGLGNPTPPPRTDSGFAPPPPGPPPAQDVSRKTKKANVPEVPPPGDFAPTGVEDEDPFADPSDAHEDNQTKTPPVPKDSSPRHTGQFNDQLGIEPFHPGFKPRPGSAAEGDSDEVAKNEGDAAQPSKAPVYRY